MRGRPTLFKHLLQVGMHCGSNLLIQAGLTIFTTGAHVTKIGVVMLQHSHVTASQSLTCSSSPENRWFSFINQLGMVRQLSALPGGI